MGKRNDCFDLLKGFACIAVVFMHCEFPGWTGVMVQCLMRWSVPLFFAISGYFCRKDTVEECLRKAKHIGVILLWAVLFYLVWGCAEHALAGDLAAYARSEFTIPNLGALLLFNGQVFVAGHLWFLFALLYVYLVYALMIRLNLTRFMKPLCALLLIGHFALSYGGVLLGRPVRVGFYRNFLFDGLPFFFMGRLFYEAETSWPEEKLARARRCWMWWIVAGALLSVAERIAIGKDCSLHIGSIAILVGLMLWATGGTYPARLSPFVTLGRDLSLYVYIVHEAVFTAFDHLWAALRLADNPVIAWLRPVNALLWSLLAAWLIHCVVESLKGRKAGVTHD